MRLKLLSLYVLSCLLMAANASATSVSWNGYYRLEATDIRNYDLDGEEKNFLLHHLALTPKIIVKDDIIVRARFDVFNNANNGVQTNQVGAFLGNPSNSEATSSVSFDDSSVIAESMGVETVAATQLYLTWLQENGAFIFGRTPKHFGMGLTHNAGINDFDHWMDTQDVIGWKILMGNHMITPYYGKKSEGSIVDKADVNILTFHYEYLNPDSGLNLGLYYEKTTSGDKIDDTGTVFGGTPTSGYSPEQINVYLKQAYTGFDLELEAGFLSGDTGVVKSGAPVSFEASGFLANFTFDFATDFHFDGRIGYATGDDPNSNNYEGFLFDRNLDVAYLLFNHKMGNSSLDLNNSAIGGASSSSVDTDYIGNTLFIAPKLTYKSSDRFHYDASLIYAKLNEVGTATTDDYLGTEIDLGMSYFPNDSTHVRLETGFLLPGGAYEGNASNSTNNAFIISGKAAINF
ncbi:MAG: hypothetical protein VX642_04190 [Bdellovibrionota bacterium]|nr:hypothetical protein [Bdellovibrionota bacterium]